jgi:putative OPT family oligopeptide transporter
VAVGYIIGLNTAVVVFFGGAIGWLVLLPLYQAIVGSPEGLIGVAAAKATWSGQIRYIGIGAMLVGGVWTLFQVRGPIWQSLRQLMALYGARNRSAGQSELLRTERDAGVVWLIGLTVAALVPMVLLYQGLLNHDLWGGIGLTLLMVVTAFLFSAVAGYMAGLVGSSSNPVSGVTIATIMLASLLLLGILGKGNPAGPAAALLVGAVVCCAAAMGGDNLQDLKTGHVVGATPWKQQVMQVIGVATGAVVIVPVLSLLQAKYGIGEVTAAHPHPLSAPQATLMANLANGVFGGSLPWHLVGVGMVLGVVVIGLDLRQARRNAALRFPVLAVALGMYLPLKLSATILFGGLLAEYVRTAGKSLRCSNGGSRIIVRSRVGHRRGAGRNPVGASHCAQFDLAVPLGRSVSIVYRASAGRVAGACGVGAGRAATGARRTAGCIRSKGFGDCSSTLMVREG